MKERAIWADCARGMAAMLVFCVHFFHMELGRTHLLVQLLNVCCLPVFYFIAGYLNKGSFSWKTWLRSNSVSILLPYLVASLGFWFLHFVQRDPDPVDRFIGIFLQLPNTPWEGGRWYVPSFFVAKLIFDYTASHFLGKYPALCLCCGGYAAAAWAYTLLGFPRLPWNIEAALFAQPFFAMGLVWKQTAQIRYERLPSWKKAWILGIAAILGLILAALNQRLGGQNIDFHTRELNEIATAYGASACAVLLMIQFSRCSSRLLAFIGQNSLTYYMYGSLIGAVTSRITSALGCTHWVARFLIGFAGLALLGIPVSLVLNRWFPWAAGKRRKTQKTGS